MNSLRSSLHEELDRILDRDDGPNPKDEVRLSVSQYNGTGGVEHITVIAREFDGDKVTMRFSKKYIISERPLL